MYNLDLAYIAGAIDCDGSICIPIKYDRYGKIQFNWMVNFRQEINRGKGTVDWVQSVLGRGTTYSSKGGTIMWTWQINKAEDIRQVLLLLKPYLKIKQKECNLMMEAMDLVLDTPRTRLGPGKPSLPDWAKERIKQISSEMNVGQQKESSRRNKEIREINPAPKFDYANLGYSEIRQGLNPNWKQSYEFEIPDVTIKGAK